MIAWTDAPDEDSPDVAPEGMTAMGRAYFDLGTTLIRAMGIILAPRPSLDMALDLSALDRYREQDGGEGMAA